MLRNRKDSTISVPWMTVLEWHYLRHCICSGDIDLQREGLDRLVCWQERLWKRCPVAIECTSNLLEARLTEAAGHVDAKSLAKLYSLAVLRCVGMLTDVLQEGLHAVPMHKLANKAGIPEWIVDLRHEATHSLGAPPLAVARRAASFLMGWLKREYWDTLDPDMGVPKEQQCYEQSDFGVEDDLRSLMLDYQQEQFKLSITGEKDYSRLEDTLKTLKERLSTEDSRTTLCSILVQDGFLIPTEEQVEALNVTALTDSRNQRVEPDKKFVCFWRPLIGAISHRGLIPKLLVALVTRLNRTSSHDLGDPSNDAVLGWILVIGTSLTNGNYLSPFMSKKNTLEAWYPVIVSCVEESNSYSRTVLEILLSTVCASLPAAVKQKLRSLLDADPGLPTDGDDEGVMMKVSDGEVFRIGETGSEEEAAAKLRGQSASPWTLAPDSIKWGHYPIGKLPGQSEDPQALNLLQKLDPERLGDFIPDDTSQVRRSNSEASGVSGVYPGSQFSWLGCEVDHEHDESDRPQWGKERIDDGDVQIL